MVNCFLCFSQDKRCRFMHFHSILTSDRTVADVVSEYFPAVPQNIAGNPSICLKCFLTLKSFSSLVDTVQLIHSYPKLNLTKCEEFKDSIKLEPEQFEIASAFDFYASCDMPGFGEAKDECETMQEDEREDSELPKKRKLRSRKDVAAIDDEARQTTSSTLKPQPKPKKRKDPNADYAGPVKKSSTYAPRPRDIKVEKYIAKHIDIKCYVCQAKMNTFTHMLCHFKRKHPNSLAYFLCCGKVIRNRNPFFEHIRISHINEKPTHKCLKCQKKFITSSQLYSHNYLYHPNIKCDKCGEKVATSQTLETHKDMHRYDDYMFECYRCKHECRGYHVLKSHLNKKHRYKRRKKQYYKTIERKCDRCDFACTHLGKLYAHLKKHHELDTIERGEGVTCPTCQKVFVTQVKFRAHERSAHHREDKRSFCEICSKMVMCLKTHMVVHEQGERVKCPHCSHYLKNKLVLSNHIKRIHERDPNKKYVCKECGKVSKTEGALWCHVKLYHKLKRELPCRFCSKLMKTPTDVKEHEATHTGVDLYFCEWCPKSFKFGASYRGHRKREHKGEYIPRSESKKYVEMD